MLNKLLMIIGKKSSKNLNLLELRQVQAYIKGKTRLSVRVSMESRALAYLIIDRS